MARGIRDLTDITADPLGAGVTTETLFEGVVKDADAGGILARKVSGKSLEDFMARSGGAVDAALIEGQVDPAGGLHSGKAYGYTDAETARAKAAEDAERRSRTEADTAETERALKAERDLGQAKANKITRSRPLSGIRNGEAPGDVTFWRSSLPAPIGVAGKLELSDGAFFETSLDAGLQTFSFTNAAGVKKVIFDGAWRLDGVDCELATVTRSENIEGSVWECARYGGEDADLADVNKTAVAAIKRASDAVQLAAQVQTALTVEKSDRETADTALDTKIETEKTDRETADTALDALIGTPAPGDKSLREDLTEEREIRKNADEDFETRVDILETEKVRLEYLPDLPQADGEYKLVITGGAATWETV